MTAGVTPRPAERPQLFLRLWQAFGHGVEWFHGRRLAKTVAALAAEVLIVAALWLVLTTIASPASGSRCPRGGHTFAPENGDIINPFVHGGEKRPRLLQLRNEQLTAEYNDNLSKLARAAQQVRWTGAEAEPATPGFLAPSAVSGCH